MRKEIIGILLIFPADLHSGESVLLQPDDPSLFNAGGAKKIHNLFGVFGLIGRFLIGVFGFGSFWIPLLLLLISIHILGGHPRERILSTVVGGLMLVLTTGALLSLRQHNYELFGNNFSAGGLAGIPLKSFLVRYSNRTGAVIILGLIWLIGFILSTGFSVLAFFARCRGTATAVVDHLKTFYSETQREAAKSEKTPEAVGAGRKERRVAIKIKSEPKVPIKTVPKPKQEVFEFMRSRPVFSFLRPTFSKSPKHGPVRRMTKT